MLDFNKIKDYYDRGLWSKEQVKKAVEMSKISELDYKEITGDDYII